MTQTHTPAVDAAQAAKLDHQRLLSLINSMADGVIAVDEHVRVDVYNAAALNILDSNSSMNGKPLRQFFKPIDSSGSGTDIGDMVRSTRIPAVNRDLLLQYGDGSRINLYLSIAPVHSGFGSSGHGGYVIVLRDITREKSLEEERDEFISVVSHELRTPIAIAEGNVGNAQFIIEPEPGLQPIKEALAQAHSQILYLSDMINDLSTLSRAERGVLSVDAEAINVYDLVRNLVAGYQEQAAAKHLRLTAQLSPHLELLYSGKLYVREILQNFVTNALKYTAAGSVTLGAKPAEGGVLFTVSDTGIGISKSDQERVFDKFFRSEDYRTRETNGTGLGLYVTAKLARLLQASITLESKLNHGSTFSIFVPNLPTTKEQSSGPAHHH